MTHGADGGRRPENRPFSLSGGIARFLVGVSPLTGGLATQTAIPSPACTDLGISTGFSRDSEVRDGCPISAEVPVLPDGLTTISQDPNHRDAFPSSAEVSDDHRDGWIPEGRSFGIFDCIFTGFSHWRKLRTSPRVGFRSSNRPR